MKFSLVFIVFFLATVGFTIGWAIEDHASGFGLAAVLSAAVFVAAALYNRLNNGTWFTDFSGGK